jgi:hypothetical protein
MGGFVGDVFDSVTDAFDDIVDIVSEAAHDLVDLAAKAAKIISDVTMTVTGIKYVDEKLTGGIITNTINGTIDNIAGMANGALSGDWVQFRNSSLGTITTAIAVSAIMAGAVTGNPWLIAAGIAAATVVLDAQYNEGELLRRTIAIAGGIETAMFNTHYIDNYAMEIQALITVGATLYAGYTGVPYLLNISGISALVAQWKTQIAMIQNYIGIVSGSYNVYNAVQAIIASQEYWKAALAEAEEYYRKLLAQAQAAKDQWFDMMTNPDMINRIQAGGDLFHLGAGHDLFSITNVAEPKYALGLIDKSDPEMDRLINNRYFSQYAGSAAFKPQ